MQNLSQFHAHSYIIQEDQYINLIKDMHVVSHEIYLATKYFLFITNFYNKFYHRKRLQNATETNMLIAF